jgi:glycosyltransferase involved in cell wall biosynthesis
MEASRNPPGAAVGISVIICCYNSSARLPDTLRYLTRLQIGSAPWEVIVVDNASTDDTAQVARDNWSVDAAAPLRVVSEPQPGLIHARRRGVAEARHEIISFIDDDNWVGTDWIERVRAIFAAHPEVGACGGRSEAVPEIEPPPWFEGIQKFYATGSQHARIGDVTDSRGALLWGAGLNMRTHAIRDLFDGGFTFLLSGRAGNATGAGEDTEMCYALREAGWHFWYDDDLVLRHFIPKERLTWNYALRLVEGLGKSAAIFDLYLMTLRRPPFHHYSALKSTWFYRWLKTGRQCLALLLMHPIACLVKPEGSRTALTFQALAARWALLQSIAGRYGKLREGILEAMPAAKAERR